MSRFGFYCKNVGIRTRVSTPASAESHATDSGKGEPLGESPLKELAYSGHCSPDLCMERDDGTVFLVVGCKRPGYFRRSSDAIPKDLLAATKEPSRETIRQVLKYIVNREVGYAILTSEDVTYFFKAEADCLFISDGLTRSSREIPLLGAIHYTLMESKSEINVRHEYARGGHGTENIQRAVTRSSRKRKKQSDDVTVDGLEEVNVVDLNVHEPVFTKGSSGNLVMGRIRGQKVIIKIAPAWSTRGEILLHEATVFKKLEPLWGYCVPRLVQYGSTCGGDVWFLATQYIDGLTFKEAIITKDVAREAVAVLSATHSLGVLHGDIHSGNILLLDGHVLFIDFGLAEYSCNSTQVNKELGELENIVISRRRCGTE